MTPDTVTPTSEPRPHQLPAGLTVSLTECVLGRDQFACLRCGDSVLQAAWTLHWRTRRHPTTTPQALILCAHCDHDVQANRRRSIRLGYLIPAGNFNPSSIPVLHHRNGWVVLTADGKWAKADPYLVADWEAQWT